MPFSNEARVEEARRLLRDAFRVLILSGQGLSVASSVPASAPGRMMLVAPR